MILNLQFNLNILLYKKVMKANYSIKNLIL
jgi:hypothetical protein